MLSLIYSPLVFLGAEINPILCPFEVVALINEPWHPEPLPVKILPFKGSYISQVVPKS